jgi:hypothetical protein
MSERAGIDDMLQRVQGEFREMPGLRLTPAQARRLWAIDALSCQVLLDALVAARFLFRTRDGAFMRVSDTERIVAPSPRSSAPQTRATSPALPSSPSLSTSRAS